MIVSCALRLNLQSVSCSCRLYIFFFKQKTAYELRISDWSSDVCSSDLLDDRVIHRRELILDMVALEQRHRVRIMFHAAGMAGHQELHEVLGLEIGRASCRERVCQYV